MPRESVPRWHSSLSNTLQVLRSKNGFANQALDRGHSIFLDPPSMENGNIYLDEWLIFKVNVQVNITRIDGMGLILSWLTDLDCFSLALPSKPRLFLSKTSQNCCWMIFVGNIWNDSPTAWQLFILQGEQVRMIAPLQKTSFGRLCHVLVHFWEGMSNPGFIFFRLVWWWRMIHHGSWYLIHANEYVYGDGWWIMMVYVVSWLCMMSHVASRLLLLLLMMMMMLMLTTMLVMLRWWWLMTLHWRPQTPTQKTKPPHGRLGL